MHLRYSTAAPRPSRRHPLAARALEPVAEPLEAAGERGGVRTQDRGVGAVHGGGAAAVREPRLRWRGPRAEGRGLGAEGRNERRPGAGAGVREGAAAARRFVYDHAVRGSRSRWARAAGGADGDAEQECKLEVDEALCAALFVDGCAQGWQDFGRCPPALFFVREAGEYELIDAQMPVGQQLARHLVRVTDDGRPQVHPYLRDAVP